MRGRNRDHSIDPLITMLELLWTDPNRHGNDPPMEPPASLEEARAAVNVDLAVVQWRRDGQIIKQ